MKLTPSVPILLVDDQQANLLVLTELLQGLDLDVVAVTSGNQALRRMAQQDFAVVLLDAQMPDMDGFETAALMRGSHRTRYVPIIFVSAVWRASAEIFKGYEAGAVDYLIQPIEPEILRSKVRIFMELYQQRRRTEEAILAADRALAREKRSEEQLLAAVAEAERANRAQSMFLAHMSHELRTPMNAVVALSELLRKTRLDERQTELLQGVCQGSDTLMATINDILDVSKIQDGRIELENQPFDLHELIEGALRLVRPQAEETGLALVCEISEHTPQRVRGDSTRLRQILLNLLSNAVKFTAAGEVRLTVKARWVARRRELSFAVSDTGIGIPSDRIENLFEPFSQVDTSTTREYGGTGLGLTLVKRLTELMGGHLEVSSELGKGSLFGFTVLLDTSLETAPGDDPQGDDVGRDERLAEHQARRILLVEDDKLNQKVAGYVMTDVGFDCDIASDGEEAVRMALEQSYDVILMDVHMPRLDGLAATRQLRQHFEADVPWIIGMTADVLESDRQRCLAAGMNDFLGKPIVAQTLLAVLERAPLASEPSAQRGAFADLQGRHVLLVDDDMRNLFALSNALHQEGVSVTKAENGKAALDLLRQDPSVDGVLMDVMMPVMDGYEAMRRIRRDEDLKHLPVIALTAKAMPEDGAKCIEAGADDYVTKPVEMSKLLSLLRTLCKGGSNP